MPTSLEQLRMRTLSVAAIRQIDRTAIERFHMHPLVLMENAAGNCARWLTARHLPPPPRAVILCGSGNNGGDGLVMARHLRLGGWLCEVFVHGPEEKLSPDALANWQILTARQSPGNTMIAPSAEGSMGKQTEEKIARAIAEAAIIIDAMLGSGARGAPRPPLDRWIELANAAAAERIAIDIPTGLDADSGEPAPITFRADHTLTFVARKPGFHQPAAQDCLGEVSVMPIGIPVELVEELLAQSVSSSPGGGS
jgi:NAD(P)H-hydrate epimerase